MERTIVIQPYKLFSVGFMKGYLITMRPYLLFVSGITGIVGMSLGPDIISIKIILVFLASFLSYGFGQAVTDCFQIDTDTFSSPYRPLVQGLISKENVLIVSIIGLTLCVSIFGYYNHLNLLLGILAGIGLYTYTYFKKKWWAGPFYNSWIVAVLFLMAFNIHQPLWLEINFITLIYALIAVFFGYANFVLTGYFKDISADRRTGYNTMPVVYGRKSAAIVSDLFALLTIAASILAIVNSKIDFTNFILWIIVLLYGFGSFLTIISQIRLHYVKTDEEAFAAISPVVHSYILLLSSIAIAQKVEWALPLILFYLCFVFVMKSRPMKNQV